MKSSRLWVLCQGARRQTRVEGVRGHMDRRKEEAGCVVRNGSLKYQAGHIAQKHREGTGLGMAWWLEQCD